MSEEIPIAEIVRELHDEILDLQKEKQEGRRTALWRISDCEIEINVVTKRTVQADGKVSVALFATSGNGSYSKEQVHKVKLKLEPITKSSFQSKETSDEYDEELLDIPAFLRRQSD